VAAAASFPAAAPVTVLPPYTPALHRRPSPAGGGGLELGRRPSPAGGGFDPPMHTVRAPSGWLTTSGGSGGGGSGGGFAPPPHGLGRGETGVLPTVTDPAAAAAAAAAATEQPTLAAAADAAAVSGSDGLAAMVRGFSTVARLAGLSGAGTAGSDALLASSRWALDGELEADLAAAVGGVDDEEAAAGPTRRAVSGVDYPPSPLVSRLVSGRQRGVSGWGDGAVTPSLLPAAPPMPPPADASDDESPRKPPASGGGVGGDGGVVACATPPRLIDPSFEEALFPDWGPGRLGAAAILAAHAFYQQLFSWVLAANGAVLAASLWGALPIAPDALPLVALGNLAVSVGARNEVLLNVFYYLLTRTPHSVPRTIRVALCRFAFHIGGLHSGAATAGSGWLLYYAVQVARGVAAADGPPAAVAAQQALSWVLVACTATLCGSSVPALRAKYHDAWEVTHRYVGWTTLGVLWAFLATDAVRRAGAAGGGGGNGAAWALAAAMTVSVALPWAYLRRVPVKSLVPSPSTVVLQFPDGAPAAGTFGRVAHHPLGCWHAFATVSASRTGRTHAMVVSGVGDWTKALVASPPRGLWVRRIRTPGFMYNVRLFARSVVLATGAGIAPVLPHLLQTPASVRVVWVCRHAEAAFGPEIPAIVAATPGAVVHDTATGGRVDMTELVLRVVHGCGAEAVFVVSSEGITRSVVGGCLVQGVPAFGAIWDS